MMNIHQNLRSLYQMIKTDSILCRVLFCSRKIETVE